MRDFFEWASGALLIILGIFLFALFIGGLKYQFLDSPPLIQILVVGGIGYFFWSNSKSSE